MREIAFNLIYVSTVLTLGVLGMTLYSLQQSDTFQGSSWLALDRTRSILINQQAFSEEKRGESRFGLK